MRKSMDERTPEEQREYLTELIPHAMHMLDIARTNLEKLEKRAANGEDVQEHIDQTRNAIEEGERALKGYRSQLAELKKAPQK